MPPHVYAASGRTEVILFPGECWGPDHRDEVKAVRVSWSEYREGVYHGLPRATPDQSAAARVFLAPRDPEYPADWLPGGWLDAPPWWPSPLIPAAIDPRHVWAWLGWAAGRAGLEWSLKVEGGESAALVANAHLLVRSLGLEVPPVERCPDPFAAADRLRWLQQLLCAGAAPRTAEPSAENVESPLWLTESQAKVLRAIVEAAPVMSGQEGIAVATMLSVRTVSPTVRELEALGLVRRGPNGKQVCATERGTRHAKTMQNPIA